MNPAWLTTLTSRGAVFTKGYRRGRKVRDYQRGHTEFEARFVRLGDPQDPLACLGRLTSILTRLGGARDTFIVRGRPAPHALKRGGLINRRFKAAPERAAPDFLPDDTRWWVCLDVDNLELSMGAPEVVMMGMDPREPWALADYVSAVVASALPSAFWGVSCVAQFSASAGVCDMDDMVSVETRWCGAKLHLWYMLERPVCGRAMRRWLAHAHATDPQVSVDDSPCSPVQPHYTARPLFIDEREDPFAGQERCQLIRGARHAAPVPLELADENGHMWRIGTWEEWQASTPEPVEWTRVEGAHTKLEEARAIAHAEGAIANADPGQRHATLRNKSIWIGKLIAQGHAEHARTYHALCAAAARAYAGDRDADKRIEDVSRIVRECIQIGKMEEAARMKARAGKREVENV